MSVQTQRFRPSQGDPDRGDEHRNGNGASKGAPRYAIRMAAVFMIATCTLALRTRFVSRWIAFVGYAAALVLLFAGRQLEWIVLIFPLWVLLLSIHILITNFGASSMAAATDRGEKGDE